MNPTVLQAGDAGITLGAAATEHRRHREAVAMQLLQARAVDVLADTDHGEGWVRFEWADELAGWDELKIDLDGHCSRRMPIYSGSDGLEDVDLSRDRVRLQLSPYLAERLRLDSEVEITFAIPESAYAELRRAVEHLALTPRQT